MLLFSLPNLRIVIIVTYVEVDVAGHQMPVKSYSSFAILFYSISDTSISHQEFAPWAAYKTLWYLIGRGEMNSTAIDSSLYPNDYQLNAD